MQNNSNLVSVVMSAYNSEITIAESIESILNQSYQNFEFLIIDFIDEPNAAQIQIDGKQTNGAVTAINNVPVIKLSSVGKNAVAAVKATTHALGLIN